MAYWARVCESAGMWQQSNV